MVTMTRQLISLTCITLALGACSHNVFSPPASTMPLTSAANVAAGRTAVRAEASTVSEFVLGPDIGVGALAARHGVTENLEVDVQGSAGHVFEKSAAGTDRNIYAGRVGAKLNPGTTRNLAFTAGLGGGHSAAGEFVSADLGIAIAYEDSRLVPFAALRGFVSEPIRAKAVDTGDGTDNPGDHIDTPRTTVGAMTRVGLKLHLAGDWRTNTSDPTLVAGLGVTKIADDMTNEVYADLSAGFEIGF